MEEQDEKENEYQEAVLDRLRETFKKSDEKVKKIFENSDKEEKEEHDK